MNRKELIELLDKYEIEYEITDNIREVEEGLRLFDEALKKIGIVIPKETRVDNITTENDLEVPKYTTEYTTDCPKGEWVKARGMAPPEFTGRYVCSNCGHYALMNMPYGSRQELSPFCPNCGAMMKGADDE